MYSVFLHMLILDGEKVAAVRLKKLKAVVARVKRPPHLAIVLAGTNEGSEAYVRQKQRVGKQVGIAVSLHRDPHPTTERIARLVRRLGRDQAVDGIIVQLPLPKGIATDEILLDVAKAKDVDGLVPGSPFIPPTPAGILALLDGYRIPVAGKHVVLWGRGELVGKPLGMLLMERGAWVTFIHRDTPNPEQVSRKGDILVSATGVTRLIRASMVKKGAVVIDVGWGREAGRIVGEVDFGPVSKKADAMSPVPGGVGPMTVVMLIENVVYAARR